MIIAKRRWQFVRRRTVNQQKQPHVHLLERLHSYHYPLLAEAGNAVVYRLYPGTTHEFFGMGTFDKARQAEQFGTARIAASFK